MSPERWRISEPSTHESDMTKRYSSIDMKTLLAKKDPSSFHGATIQLQK